MAEVSVYTCEQQLVRRAVCIIVGLPLRRKTYATLRMARYLSLLWYKVRIFRYESYRLKASNNAPVRRVKERQSDVLRESIMNDIIKWFNEDKNQDVAKFGLEKGEYDTTDKLQKFSGVQLMLDDCEKVVNQRVYKCLEDRDMVAFYDNDNLNSLERKKVYSSLKAAGLDVLFLEFINDFTPNEQIVRELTEKIEPQYLQNSLEDEKLRLTKLLNESIEIYEPLSFTELNNDIQFIKYIDNGVSLISSNMRSFVSIKLFDFLTHFVPSHRSFFICRHGESKYNIEERIGGDPELSVNGVSFSKDLAKKVTEMAKDQRKNLVIWTSTLLRARQTVNPFIASKIIWKFLDELNSGVFESYTYKSIRSKFKDQYLLRAQDKFCYCYYYGESYRDLFHRMIPVLMELEAHSKNDLFLLIVGHQAVLRIINAYFSDTPIHLIPYIDIPLHTLIKIEYNLSYTYKIENFIINWENAPSSDRKRESSLNSTLIRDLEKF